MEKLKKFFGDSKQLVTNFRINIILATVTGIILPIILNKGINVKMFNTNFYITILFIALYAGLFFSFKKHESNLQKSLISAVYVLFIVNQIYEMKNFMNAIIFIIIYILHLSLMSDKKGTKINLKLYYVLIFLGLIFEITRAIIVRELPALLTSIPTIFLLVNIDTKIFIYKETRAKFVAEGNWTEENKNKTKEIFNI